MKNLVLFCFLACSCHVFGQTMQWVPISQDASAGKCISAGNTKNNYLCYALEYVPKVSGTLTSYTTGFLVSCTSQGSAVVKNETCSMSNSVRVIEDCTNGGRVLFNSSGNSGTAANNKIESGKPVYLHQVCFNIPVGETITVSEETLTDLTTSVDLGSGMSATEFPEFITQEITRPRYDDAKPTEWLDFKVIAAGERKAQLDWTVSNTANIAKFYVERSTDGITFEKIGEVSAIQASSKFSSFQHFDENAPVGKNYYRIQIFSSKDEIEGSPVRWLTFERLPFGASVSPNPATSYILVDVRGHSADYEIRLFDAAGKEVLLQKQDRRALRTKIDVSFIESGVYTLQVKSGDEVFTEKLSILQR